MSTSSTNNQEIPHRTLGATGEKVSCIGLGGWHLALKHVDEPLAFRIIRGAIDRGITFMDNCWDYNKGQSEIRMGKALRDGYREKVFLMTKIDGRSGKEATKQLDECLQRMQVDMIDLVQHHEILRFEDPYRILDEEGAHQALVKAQKAGKLRYIGFTGHKDPHSHLNMLDVARDFGVTFDSVQMPLNVMDAHYRSFEQLVLPRLVKENIAVLGMKSLANGNILKSRVVTALECIQYALSLPTSVVICGIDRVELLDQAIEAAKTYKQMDDKKRKELLARTAPASARGQFEPFKSTSIYDGTAYNPDWLGEEPQRVRDLI